MAIRTFRGPVGWLSVLYLAAIASVLWPAIHEGFDLRITMWNCLLPTIAYLIVLLVSSQNRARRFPAVAFAAVAILVTIAFGGAWAFTSLDTDPHSAMTVLVFIYAPIVSLGVATLAYVVMRLIIADAKQA